MNAELPDLWDLAQGTWEDCSGPSRFKEEAAQEPLVAGIRELTSKPVVGVGRFTSPDMMARMVRAGRARLHRLRPAVDRRPVPAEEDRGGAGRGHPRVHRLQHLHHRRHDHVDQPLHPEPDLHGGMAQGLAPGADEPEGQRARTCSSSAPARRGSRRRGRSACAAMTWRWPRRGTKLGGRVARERLLPGLSAWGRVADYRAVPARAAAQRRDLFRQPARRRRDPGVRLRERRDRHRRALAGRRRRRGCTWCRCRSTRRCRCSRPTTSWTAACRRARSCVFDDDHYYMGGVIAELLARAGCTVTLVTPSAYVSDWTLNTLEQARDPAPAGRGRRADRAQHRGGGGAGGRRRDRLQLHRRRGRIGCDAVGASSASRLSEDGLYHALTARQADWADAGIRSVRVIGDACAPGTIACGDLCRAPLCRASSTCPTSATRCRSAAR